MGNGYILLRGVKLTTSSYLLPWVDEQVGLILHVNEKLNTKEGLMRHVKTFMKY